MKIKELNKEERPRERLLAKGPGALSNAELLAILLRTGNGMANALDLAFELISAAGSLTGLSSMSIDKMKDIPGIGKDKAATVTAAIELGRRFTAEAPAARKVPVTKPEQIYALLIPEMKGLDHEECWIVYLNRSNYVIAAEKVSSGGLASTSMDTSTILRKALEKKAAGLILSHNHPSGNPYPGAADLKETERLKNAASTFGISLMDHVVISDDCYYSFADEQITYV